MRLCPHKPHTSHVRHLPESNGFIKSDRLRRGIRCQFDLAHMAVSGQYLFQQGRSDAFALIFRKNQDILHKYDRSAIAYNPDDSGQLIILISCQYQQGLFKSLLQSCRVVGIGTLAHG